MSPGTEKDCHRVLVAATTPPPKDMGDQQRGTWGTGDHVISGQACEQGQLTWVWQGVGVRRSWGVGKVLSDREIQPQKATIVLPPIRRRLSPSLLDVICAASVSPEIKE